MQFFNSKNILPKEVLLLIAIIILGAIIRFYPIPNLTSGIISFNSGLMLATSSNVITKGLHPPDQAPLRYAIMYCFLFFGRDEFVIRLPARLFGILCLLFIYLLGKRLFDKNVGLLSTFLLTVSLWHIHHSSYAENYTLYTFLTIVSAYYFFRTLKEDSLLNPIMFVFVTTLGFYAFYPFLLVMVMEFLFGMQYAKNKKKLWYWFFLLFILISPGLYFAYQGFIWKKSFGDYPWGWTLTTLLPSFLATIGGVRGFIPINIIIFLYGFFRVYANKDEREKGIFFFYLFCFPAFFFLVCFFFNMNLAERYFLFIYPFFIILSSVGIVSFQNKIVRIFLITLFCSATIFYTLHKCGYSYFERFIPSDYRRHYADFGFIDNYLKANYKKGDAVAIEYDKGIFAVQYYIDKQNLYPVKLIRPSCNALPYLRYDGARIKDMFGLEEFAGPERFIRMRDIYQRLWVIDLYHISYNDSFGKVQEWLDRENSLKKEFGGGTIYLFENKRICTKKSNEYQCDKKICYLDCNAKEIYEVVYPYQK